MKPKYFRPAKDRHFPFRFLIISAILSGFSGFSCCANPVTQSHDSDILISHSQITTDAGTRYMVFPPGKQAVRLYLIDSGISHKSTWFARNPNLVFEPSYNPVVSTSSLHGTRMLDIIAGPESGAVAGTPVRVVSMNIYASDLLSTTSGLMADAVFEAIDREQEAADAIPAVICLASGSPAGSSSSILETAIQQAVDAGIPVVVSAGNSGDDASKFIPSSYGTKDGVICVGAHAKNLQPLPMSNWGAPVDLKAPGESVRTLSLPLPVSGLYQGMTGTSPAAALTTAAVIHQLSLNPTLSPAEVEAALGSSLATPAPSRLEYAITEKDDERFLDVSFVSCQLLTGTAAGGLTRPDGCAFSLEWSGDLKSWHVDRFTDVGAPVEVPGGWRYTARSKVPVLSRTRFADLTVTESSPRLITTVTINDRLLALPRAPYQLPDQALLLQEDLLAAGLAQAVVQAEGAKGYRIHVPDVLYTTPRPGSWITWPPFVSGIDPLSGQPMISGGVSFRATYHLADGTPVDPPVQMARLRTVEAP
jgi:hypothetical protein